MTRHRRAGPTRSMGSHPFAMTHAMSANLFSLLAALMYVTRAG